MISKLPRLAAFRAAACGVLGLAVLLVACERQLPTSAEVAAMDAAAAESQLQELGLITPETGVVIYYLDGVQVSATQAHSLAADRISRVTVLRSAESGVARIELRTAQPGEGHAGTIRTDTLRNLAVRLTPEGPPVLLLESRGGTGPATAGFEGVILLDGVRVSPAALRGLRPENVAGVEIIKGEAALRMYDDPRAAQGVIRITTREGAGRR